MAVYSLLLASVFISAPIIFIILLFVDAPYGKHTRSGWGIQIDNRLAWIIMELPAVFVIAYFFVTSNDSSELWIYLVIWEAHYLYRTFYFPSKMKGRKKSFPILIILFAILFNCINGFLNGYFLFHLAPELSKAQIESTSFLLGLMIFIIGFYTHYKSDKIILNLRTKTNDDSYNIPKGFLFEQVSSPNYLGEIIQWIGWAVLTWSAAGLAFAVFTFCNLAPRAISNHRWYHSTFEDYPKTRKVLLPYLY